MDDLGDIDGDADGAALIDDGAGDGAAYPPGRVGAEAVAFVRVEFLDGADQADVAFLDEVGERDAAHAVLLGDGDDEAEVRLGQFVFGLLVAALNGAGQTDLFVGGEQLRAPRAAHPDLQTLILARRFFLHQHVYRCDRLQFLLDAGERRFGGSFGKSDAGNGQFRIVKMEQVFARLSVEGVVTLFFGKFGVQRSGIVANVAPTLAALLSVKNSGLATHGYPSSIQAIQGNYLNRYSPSLRLRSFFHSSSAAWLQSLPHFGRVCASCLFLVGPGRLVSYRTASAAVSLCSCSPALCALAARFDTFCA